MDPVPRAEELVVPHQHEGAGLEPLRVLHPSFAAVGDTRRGCPPSGGSFSQGQSHLFSHQFTILMGFHCQGTIHDQVLASAMTNQH